MADSTKSAVDFLEDLKREREELDSLIRALEKRLGIESSQSVSVTDRETPSNQEVHSLGRARTRDAAFTPLAVGFFHNMSQAAAAEKLLKLNRGHALKTGDILEAFRNSGMPLNPKNAVQILYTALKRNPKFERVGKRAWGLREWYPEKKKRAGVDRDNLPDHNPTVDVAETGDSNE